MHLSSGSFTLYLSQCVILFSQYFTLENLFANSKYHKLCLDTWSFNPRMMRVAEKVGFVPEGFQRQMQFWGGEWLDFMHYGMLRAEWENLRSGSSENPHNPT